MRSDLICPSDAEVAAWKKAQEDRSKPVAPDIWDHLCSAASRSSWRPKILVEIYGVDP
jgi:hypothetical protein